MEQDEKQKRWDCCVRGSCEPETCSLLPHRATCAKCSNLSKCFGTYGVLSERTACVHFPTRYEPLAFAVATQMEELCYERFKSWSVLLERATLAVRKEEFAQVMRDTLGAGEDYIDSCWETRWCPRPLVYMLTRTPDSQGRALWALVRSKLQLVREPQP